MSQIKPVVLTDVYSGACQTKDRGFLKKTIVAKNSILDAWQGSVYTSAV